MKSELDIIEELSLKIINEDNKKRRKKTLEKLHVKIEEMKHLLENVKLYLHSAPKTKDINEFYDYIKRNLKNGMRIFNPEIEEGNIEYKRHLNDVSEKKFHKLAAQMKWRVGEGDGQAVYYIGINDDGKFHKMNSLEKATSLETMIKLCIENKFQIKKFENDQGYYKFVVNDPEHKEDIQDPEEI